MSIPCENYPLFPSTDKYTKAKKVCLLCIHRFKANSLASLFHTVSDIYMKPSYVEILEPYLTLEFPRWTLFHHKEIKVFSITFRRSHLAYCIS